MNPVDAVITWVDGSDPAFRARRAAYGGAALSGYDDVAGETRYDSLGEIFWCVASLNRFAPWIRRIFLVTDGQDPGLDPVMERWFPGGHIPVEVVDHRVIFRGFEDCLPVFNSIAIETMTWRIPGLSERYLELNDDFLLCAPASPADFFDDAGRPVCYASRESRLWTRFTRSLKPLFTGRNPVTFKGVMLHGAERAGKGCTWLRYNHTPRALLRSVFARWYEAHPEALTDNIRHRFRDPSQYSAEELQYMLLYRRGALSLRPVRGTLFFLQPKGKPGYVDARMDRLARGSYRYCCFNSLDKATPEERARIRDWIGARLGIKFLET